MDVPENATMEVVKCVHEKRDRIFDHCCDIQ